MTKQCKRYRSSTDVLHLTNADGQIFVDAKSIQPVFIKNQSFKLSDFVDHINHTGVSDSNIDALVSAFVASGIVFCGADGDCKGERQKAMYVTKKHRHISLYLLVTQFCNLQCTYCYNGEDSYSAEKHLKMSASDAKTAIASFIGLVSDGGTLEIIYFGGEPLLNWGLVKETISWAESFRQSAHPEKRIHHHITTNLTVMPSDLISMARKYKVSILVDIDGPEEIHNMLRPANRMNSFQRTAKNVSCLVQNGIRPHLRATITSVNVDRMLEISLLHRNIGGASTALVPVNLVNSDRRTMISDLAPQADAFKSGLERVFLRSGWGKQQIKPLSHFIKRIRPNGKTLFNCGAAIGKTPTVSASGDIYPCIYVVGNDEFKFCDINTIAAYEPAAKNFYNERVQLDLSCKQCVYRNFCGEGCYAPHWLSSGNDPWVKTYQREMTCATTKACVDFLLWDLVNSPTLKET